MLPESVQTYTDLDSRGTRRDEGLKRTGNGGLGERTSLWAVDSRLPALVSPFAVWHRFLAVKITIFAYELNIFLNMQLICM